MSLYGYERETSPNIEALASRSTVYPQARSPSIHSIASHVSMFTGLHVEEHGALDHTAHIDPERSIWTELSTDFDYSTALFTNNRIVSNASNLGAHFDHRYEPDYPLSNRLENMLGNRVVERAYFRLSDTWARVRRRIPDRGPIRDRFHAIRTSVGQQRSRSDDGHVAGDSGFKTRFGGEFTDGFLQWASHQEGHWAACINVMDTHMPYHPASRFDRWAADENWRIQRESLPSVRASLEGDGWDEIERLEALYDGTIRQADAIVGDLIASLEDQGMLSDTLLVVTSDHGEGFGERSRIDSSVRIRGHRWGIHEVLTHVPLAIKRPGQTEGNTVDSVVSLTDLPDLFRATATGEQGNGDPLVSDGPVLSSTYRLPEEKTAKFASVDGVDRFVGPWRAVYEDREGRVRKSARNGMDAVTVDIGAPGDVNTISHSDGGRVEEAYEALDRSDVLTHGSTEIDDDLEEQLRQLGYIR